MALSRDTLNTPTRNYTVPCTNELRQRVLALAVRRQTTVGGIVRSCLALVGSNGHPDVSDPGWGQPEPVVIACRNGRSRRILRQPSLRLRLPTGLTASGIRSLLSLALLLDDPAAARLFTPSQIQTLEAAQQGTERLRQALEVVAFRPLRDGVMTPRQATYVLGFLHELGLDRKVINTRFRALAPLFHPDTGVVRDSDRMRQLVEARNLLLRNAAA